MFLLTNDLNPEKENLLRMFYRGVASGQIAYADLKNVRTEEVIPMLVGLELDKNGKVIGAMPIARLSSGEEMDDDYLFPDGQGGYSKVD